MRQTARYLLGVLAATSQLVWTQPISGPTTAGMAGAPMRMGFGARGISMSNAISAVLTGDLVTYYNPALAPFQEKSLVTASYSALSLDRRLNFFSYGQNLKPSAGLAVGIINAGVSNIEGRDRDGIQTGTYSTSENSFFFSFGILLDPQFSLGVTGKLLYYSLFEGISSSTAGLDVGILYKVSDNLSLGVVLQDINSKYIWDTSKLYGTSGNTTTDNFPLRKKIGLSCWSSDINALLASELEFVAGETFIRFGLEANIGAGLMARAGLDQVSFSRDLNPRPSIGFSFEVSDVTWQPGINYAYVFEPYSPQGIHVISVSLHFE